MNRWVGLFGKVFLYQRGRVAALGFLLFFAALVGLGERSLQPNATSAAPVQVIRFITAPVAAIRQD